MKLNYAATIAASLGLALASAVQAHPGDRGAGAEQHMKGGMHHGMKGGAHGKGAGMGHGAMGGAGGHGAAQQLMTPEERTALREKMRNATPEERQKIAAATRSEMQKRAQEKGITLPEHRGPHAGNAPQAPATTEHAH